MRASALAALAAVGALVLPGAAVARERPPGGHEHVSVCANDLRGRAAVGRAAGRDGERAGRRRRVGDQPRGVEERRARRRPLQVDGRGAARRGCRGRRDVPCAQARGGPDLGRHLRDDAHPADRLLDRDDRRAKRASLHLRRRRQRYDSVRRDRPVGGRAGRRVAPGASNRRCHRWPGDEEHCLARRRYRGLSQPPECPFTSSASRAQRSGRRRSRSSPRKPAVPTTALERWTSSTAVYRTIADELKRTWRLEYVTTALPGDPISVSAALPGGRPQTLDILAPGVPVTVDTKTSDGTLPDQLFGTAWGRLALRRPRRSPGPARRRRGAQVTARRVAPEPSRAARRSAPEGGRARRRPPPCLCLGALPGARRMRSAT